MMLQIVRNNTQGMGANNPIIAQAGQAFSDNATLAEFFSDMVKSTDNEEYKQVYRHIANYYYHPNAGSDDKEYWENETQQLKQIGLENKTELAKRLRNNYKEYLKKKGTWGAYEAQARAAKSTSAYAGENGEGQQISALSLDPESQEYVDAIVSGKDTNVGDVEPTDDEILDLLNEVGLRDFMIGKNLDYKIEENGGNISVGEKQLICIARALLKKTKIILMDEATANIDYRNESILKQNINEDTKESTVITIAHRIKTVINYDKILVMKDGEIEEFDTPENLINKKGLFYQMYKGSLA
jgi:ABC-type dipeptide/oligopeptide/nickel transport system ATPase subunit